MDDKVTISDEALAQFSCWDSWDKTHTAFSSIARELLAFRRQAQEAPKVICKSCDFYEGCAQNVIELAKRYAAVVEAANVAKRFLESEDCEKGVYQREVLAAIDKSLFDLEAKPDDGKGE